VYEVAKTYNQFYQEVPVLKEPDEKSRLLRLMLSAFTANVIFRSLSLLGIESPGRM
jgi:arginyl-tRNA synthetase